MTPSGSMEHGLGSASFLFRRREAVLWLLIILLANYAVHTIDTTSISALAVSLASQNIIYWFACYVVVRRAIEVDIDGFLTGFETVAVAIFSVAVIATSFVGYKYAVGVLFTILAAYLVTAKQLGLSLRAAGIVLLSISIHIVWARFAFQYFGPYILVADAFAVKTILAVVGSNVTQIGTTFYSSGDHAVSLVGACSSFENVSIALLAYVAMVMAMRYRWYLSDARWIAFVCIAMVVINSARMALLATSHEAYLYWHEGVGSQYSALFQTAVVLAVSFYGASKHAESI